MSYVQLLTYGTLTFQPQPQFTVYTTADPSNLNL